MYYRPTMIRPIHGSSVVIAAFALLVGGISGCDEDPAGTCDRIIEACHEKDTGSGPEHDCHEFAESDGANDETCSEREEQCLADCAD